jgi:hypothetical protein
VIREKAKKYKGKWTCGTIDLIITDISLHGAQDCMARPYFAPK